MMTLVLLALKMVVLVMKLISNLPSSLAKMKILKMLRYPPPPTSHIPPPARNNFFRPWKSPKKVLMQKSQKFCTDFKCVNI